MGEHGGDALGDDGRREKFGERRGDGLQQRAVPHEMHIGVHGEARLGQDQRGAFHDRAIKANPLGQLEPALDAAGLAAVTVMILDPPPPFAPFLGRRQASHQRGILGRDRGLIIIAIERPGLHLCPVQLAIMQQAMERMVDMIALGADLPQRSFQFIGREKHVGHGW